MTDEQLAALETMAAAATPGPWTTGIWFTGPCGEYNGGTVVYGDGRTIAVFHQDYQSSSDYDNAEFVAAARAAVPALVAEVRRLRAELAAVPVQAIADACFCAELDGARANEVYAWLEDFAPDQHFESA